MCGFWCGAESLDDKSEWRPLARDTGEVLQLSGAINLAPQRSLSHQMQHSTVQACLVSDATLAALQFPIHIMHLPHWSEQIKTLTSLNRSSRRCLETLPLTDILQLPLLTSLSCEGCSQLWSVPHEVCKQGGQATMRFLREVERAGRVNRSLTLFLIGDGEAGKTPSVIMSLESKSLRATFARTTGP